MRILLVSPYFPPQHATASLRIYSFARSWAQAGCDVTVLTTVKRPDQRGLSLRTPGIRLAEIDYRPPAFLERLRSAHKAPAHDVAAVSKPRRWLQLLRQFRERTGIFAAVRMPDLTDFWVQPALSWARGQTGTWDVVVSSIGPYTAHLVARELKQEGRARFWVADFRDLWTQNHIYCGLFPFTLKERFEEKRCLAEADLIVTVTDGLAAKLRARARRPVAVIYNGYDPTRQVAVSPAPFFPADGLCRLVYVGTVHPQGQDPGLLLRALRRLQDHRDGLAQKLALVVAGWNGSLWLELARRHGVSGLVYDLGVLKHEEALRLQRDASALVLLDWRDPAQGVLTSKLFEYLHATAPVLAVGGSKQSCVGQMLERTRRGFHLGSNVAAIADTLAELVDDPGRFHRLPQQNLLAELTRPVQSQRLLHLMEDGLYEKKVAVRSAA
jgi:glycosyltransferase involved in cell wall biosynthesis